MLKPMQLYVSIAMAMLCCLALCDGVIAAIMPNNIGIYFDESGETNCIESDLAYPYICNAFIVLKDVDAQGGIGGWEATVDWDSTLTVVATGFRGDHVQFDSFPSISVGLSAPLSADSCVVLADLLVYATGPGGLYIKPHQSPMIIGADSPIFVFGDDPDLFALTSYAFGDSGNVCATLGLPECPDLNDFSDELPDSTGGALVSEFVIVTQENTMLLPEREGPFSLADLTFSSPELRSALAGFGDLSVDRVFDETVNREIVGRDGQTVQLLGGNDAFVLALEDANKSNSEGVLDEVPAVLSVEGNVGGEDLDWVILPNDPGLSQQWSILGPNSADVIDAWDYSFGDPTVTICVVDKGVRSGHPEFAGKRSGDVIYSGDHGARVAGIAAANTNNEQGIAGVNRRAHVNFQYEDGTPAAIADAIARGLHFSPDVMNHSYRINVTGYDSGSILHRLFIDAYKLGVVHTVAAGNHYYDGDPHIFPARFGWEWEGYDQGMVVVSGTTASGAVWPASSSGPYIDIAAPAEDIVSTTNEAIIGDPNDGTSFSAPLAAGAAALLKNVWPELAPNDVDAVLKLSAMDLPPAGYDERTGWGLLQVAAAIELLNSNTLDHESHTLGGATETGTSNWYYVSLEGFPGYSTDPRNVDVIRVVDDITFSDEYVSPPAVWGRGNGSSGLGDRPWYNVNYTNVVEGSITTTGCTVESYVYRMPGTNVYIPSDYYPFSKVTWAISVLGEKVPVSVDDTPIPPVGRLEMVMDGPNPFNAATRFMVSVPNSANVDVSIYDLRGRVVKKFKINEGLSGEVKLDWDGRDELGRNCSSGVYLAIAKTGDLIAELKLVLAK